MIRNRNSAGPGTNSCRVMGNSMRGSTGDRKIGYEKKDCLVREAEGCDVILRNASAISNSEQLCRAQALRMAGTSERLFEYLSLFFITNIFHF